MKLTNSGTEVWPGVVAFRVRGRGKRSLSFLKACCCGFQSRGGRGGKRSLSFLKAMWLRRLGSLGGPSVGGKKDAEGRTFRLFVPQGIAQAFVSFVA